jgi:hypothetical protein
MYSVTTFMWKDGFRPTPIPAYQGKGMLTLQSLEIRMSSKSAHINLVFTSDDERDAYQFIKELERTLHCSASSAVGLLKPSLSFYNIEASEDIGVAEWIMRKYAELFEFCGIQRRLIPVPRLVTELFEGRYDGDPKSISSGQFLLSKVLGENPNTGTSTGELVKR